MARKGRIELLLEGFTPPQPTQMQIQVYSEVIDCFREAIEYLPRLRRGHTWQ
jgi:hypothetical protein